jgi:nucleotide-binding universal stress UspA family protein
MRILIAYDGSTSADAAIDDLRRAGLPQQAEALVICVGDGDEPVLQTIATVRIPKNSAVSTSATLAEARSIAAEGEKRIKSCFPGWTVSSDALCGAPAKVLAKATSWWHPDLFVIGSHGRAGVRRLFLGSVSWELIHRAECPVRVTRLGRSRSPDDPVRIVIGIDGSPEAEAAVRSVTTRSWPAKTEVQIIAAMQPLALLTTALGASTLAQEPAYSVIQQADERLRIRLGKIAAEAANALCRAGLIATTHVVDSDPREAILAAAEVADADAIFVGARGLGLMDRLLLGSVSSYVVTHAHCSVEVVRGKQAQ